MNSLIKRKQNSSILCVGCNIGDTHISVAFSRKGLLRTYVFWGIVKGNHPRLIGEGSGEVIKLSPHPNLLFKEKETGDRRCVW